MMNILILGCGQTGQALAQQLQQQGHRVTTVSRHAKVFTSPDQPPNEPIIHLVQDIHDLKLTASVDERALFDWVYVIVSPDESSVTGYQHTFIDTARPVFEALQSHPIQRIVLITSTRVYGEDRGGYIDDHTLPYTRDAKGQCLIAAEQLWSAHWQEKLLIVRPSGLYREHSPRMHKLAHYTDKINAIHWSNRIHRDDLVGFLSYLLKMNPSELKPDYIVTDQQSLAQHRILNFIRTRDGLSELSVENGLPQTGKRLSAPHMHSSGYQLIYPDFFAAHAINLE